MTVACLPAAPASAASGHRADLPLPGGRPAPRQSRAGLRIRPRQDGSPGDDGRCERPRREAGRQEEARQARPKKPKLPVNAERAQIAFEAMQKTYYIPGSGLYQGEPFSFLWPFSQAFAATVSMANIPSLKSAFGPELRARLDRPELLSRPRQLGCCRKGPSRARWRPSTAPSRRRQGRAGRSTTTTTSGSGSSSRASTS